MTAIPLLDTFSGAHCATHAPQTLVATAPDDWQALRKAVLGDDPQIDDGRLPQELPAGTTALGIFLGTASSGGHAAGISAVREEDGKVTVEWSHHRPRGIATMALTSPYLVALIPTPSKPVDFLQVPGESAPRPRAPMLRL